MLNAVAIYHRTKKVRDEPWNTFVCRPIAAVFVQLLAGTRITPNQVTLSSLCLALVAAGLLIGVPGRAGLVIGIVVYELSYVLDCVDGMLARYRGIQSLKGHLLDFLMDEIKAFVVLSAVSVRWYFESARPERLLLGLLGLTCLASGIAMTSFLRHPEIAPSAAGSAQAAPGANSRTLLGSCKALAERVGKFLIHYPSYIWLVAVTGQPAVYIYPYVVVNVAYAARAGLGIAWRFGRS